MSSHQRDLQKEFCFAAKDPNAVLIHDTISPEHQVRPVASALALIFKPSPSFLEYAKILVNELFSQMT